MLKVNKVREVSILRNIFNNILSKRKVPGQFIATSKLNELVLVDESALNFKIVALEKFNKKGYAFFPEYSGAQWVCLYPELHKLPGLSGVSGLPETAYALYLCRIHLVPYHMVANSYIHENSRKLSLCHTKDFFNKFIHI